MKNINKNLFFWLLLFVLLIMGYDLFFNDMNKNAYYNYPFSDFLTKVDDGQVNDIVIQGRNIEGKFNDGVGFNTYSPDYYGLIDKLQKNNIRFKAIPIDNKASSILGFIFSIFPVLLLAGIWIFFMRQMQGGGGKAMGFGKSKAKLLMEKPGKVTFNDVAGIDEAKEELSEIVEFLKDPAKFQKLGGKIPKGCLLIGPPGTGKTLLARAIAGEANVPFFSTSGSEFVEMFVGVGASRMRDMFEQGLKNAPCIIFIDEIDAVGRHRGSGLGNGNDEREQTLNQLLVEMDGFEANEGVIIIAATNRPDVLDPALLRPGRFDRQIIVSTPDIAGREKVLKVHLAKVVMGPDVDARVIARGTPGFSGADLANLVNEAALLAARRNKKLITMMELESAKDKVMMGAERKSMIMSDEDKTLTAYHEAGHAIIALNCPASDPIHKATIIPRGRALGMVMRLPEADKHSLTRAEALSHIQVAMGGRVAEELIFGYDKVTSGASSDIKSATSTARAMVVEWGMSDKLGPIFYGEDNNNYYNQNLKSEGIHKVIDSEIEALVKEGHDAATKILTKEIDNLHLLAKTLLKYETLSGDEIKAILAGETIKKDEDDDDNIIHSSFSNEKKIDIKPTIQEA